MKHLFLIVVTGLMLQQCRNKEETVSFSYPGKPLVPSSIQQQHDTLLNKLSVIALFGDSTGKLAIRLQELVAHHFKEEEDYVLPALGVLPLLANGKLPDESKELIRLIDKFRSNAAHMIAEHQLIKAYLSELAQMAVKENHPEIAEFEKELHKHSGEEEEVFFPAALLVGDYLKLKLPSE
jgi:hypothetical protein